MAKKKEFTLTFTKVGSIVNISQTDSGFSPIELIGLLNVAILEIADKARNNTKQEEVK